MAKTANPISFWGELACVGLYKRNQGRLSRQLTAAGLGTLVTVGAYTLSQGPLSSLDRGFRVAVPCIVVAVGAWLVFRLVNYPRFADFLISVEGEMNKVSWASKTELYRATIVVLSSMLFLGAVLFAYDNIWLFVLSRIGVLQI